MESNQKKTSVRLKIHARRPFLLLEVLIAFTFVVAAFFPLVYPHFYIYQQQRRFVDKIEIDMAVNNAYGVILEQLHQNKISWQSIEEGQIYPIDDQFWLQAGSLKKIPYGGYYQLKVNKSKQNERYGLSWVILTLNVTAGAAFKTDEERAKKSLVYRYDIFLSRLYTKV